MAQFLTHVNDLLLTVGELEAPDFQGVASRKAVLAWQAAIKFVSNTHRWRHLRVQVTPSSWVGNTTAVVPAYQSVLGVTVQPVAPATLVNKLKRVPYDVVYEKIRQPVGTPTIWSERTETSIIMEPVAVSVRPTILVDLVLQPTVPSLVSDNVVLPQNFLQCCQRYAEAEMHRIHTTDNAARQQALQTFEMELQTLRTRESSDLATSWRY